jgi:hypothetical protein
MYHLFFQYGKQPMHIFIISFIVFLVLNIFENLIHYNIGIHSDDNKIKINMPTQRDWIRIIITMFTFAFLQGFCVLFFMK